MPEPMTSVPAYVRGRMFRLDIPTADLPERIAVFVPKLGGTTKRCPSMPQRAALELSEPIARGKGHYIRCHIDLSIQPFKAAFVAHREEQRAAAAEVDDPEPVPVPAPASRSVSGIRTMNDIDAEG